jgi:hypothetical protein
MFPTPMVDRVTVGPSPALSGAAEGAFLDTVWCAGNTQEKSPQKAAERPVRQGREGTRNER